MASYTLSPVWGAGAQLFTDDGVPLAGGKIYTYAAGTTTPQTTWTTPTGSSANTNPIILDAAGRPPQEIWLNASFSYKFVVQTSDNVLVRTYDNIPSLPQPPVLNDAANISYQQGNTVSAGSFVVGQTYVIASVGSTDFVAVGASANTSGLTFVATGVGSGSGTAYNTQTVQEKLRQYVSVDDFGATGDGITDDTIAIQAALSSGASKIIFSNGKTYLVNGGLTCSTPSVLISAYGATIKLKDNASNTYILTCTGNYAKVFGGTWDLNRANGNTGTNPYLYWAVLIDCNYGFVKDTTAKSSYGAGLLGRGNYLTFQNNTVSDCIYWGIFITALPATDYYGNKAIGNVIDSSASDLYGQGILFSSTGDSTGQQRDWVLANNTITGPQGASVASQCICLAVRGERGIVANNVTRYGSMGFSEGGDETTVTGNVFTNLQGLFQYGIEPTGSQAITGNYVSGAKRGINASVINTSFDKTVVTGNTFITTDIAIRFAPVSGHSANDLLISGNYLSGVNQCIALDNTCDRPTIVGNKMVTAGAGNGVILRNGSAAPYAFVSSNSFSGIVNPIVAFTTSAPLVTYTDLYSTANNFYGCTYDKWRVDGVSALGTRVSSVGCILSNGTAKENTIDEAAKQIEKWGTGTPEGVVAAGVGSVFHRTDGSAGTSLYIKESGTGNTGWVAK